MRIFLTGRSRVGKTTLCIKCYEFLKGKEVNVGGVVTKEIVRGNKREGFEIINLETKERALLAHIKGSGPRFGKYRIFVENIENYMIPWIEESIEKDFVIIDEVGPMELFSKKFLRVIEKVVEEKNDFLITIHRKKINLIERWKPYTFFEMTFENRNLVWEEIKRMLLNFVEKIKKSKKI